MFVQLIFFRLICKEIPQVSIASRSFTRRRLQCIGRRTDT